MPPDSASVHNTVRRCVIHLCLRLVQSLLGWICRIYFLLLFKCRSSTSFRWKSIITLRWPSIRPAFKRITCAQSLSATEAESCLYHIFMWKFYCSNYILFHLHTIYFMNVKNILLILWFSSYISKCFFVESSQWIKRQQPFFGCFLETAAH